MEELTQQNLLLGLQVEELRSREDPLEVSFTPLWAGGGGEWFCCLRRWTRGVRGVQGVRGVRCPVLVSKTNPEC